MKCFLVLFCICLISCDKAVYFFGTEENQEDDKNLPSITDRNSIELLRKKEVRLKPSDPDREVKKNIYPEPQERQLAVLDGKTEFIQLADANFPSFQLPEPESSLALPEGLSDNLPSSFPPLSSSSSPPLPSLPSLSSASAPAPPPPSAPSTSLLSLPSLSPPPTALPLPPSHQPAISESLPLKALDIDTTVFELVENSPDLPDPSSRENSNTLPSISPPVSLLSELSPSSTEMPLPTEEFILRPLDILFVMDTSASMRSHLKQFKEKFSGFLRHFVNLDWQFALTNADYGEADLFIFNFGALKGKVMPLEKKGEILNLYYLHPGIPDYDQIFLDSVSIHKSGEYVVTGNRVGRENIDPCQLPPFCQGPQEQPLKSLKAALVQNEDFFRKEADLVVIIISNSKEKGGDSDSSTEPAEVIAQFKNVHGDKKRFEVYGIIIIEDDTACLHQNQDQQVIFPEADFSDKIVDLSTMTGGEVFSICAPHYQDVAQSIFASFGKSQTK